jgi:hypothetical protein
MSSVIDTITLTWTEAAMASDIGRLRRLTSIKNGVVDKAAAYSPGWSEDLEGACAEFALAKHLNIHWDGSINTFKSRPDVGSLEVRVTSYPNGRLIVRPRDADDATYVLLIGICPTYRLMGCIRGFDAKRNEWLTAPDNKGRPEAYFVPQNALSPIRSLR